MRQVRRKRRDEEHEMQVLLFAEWIPLHISQHPELELLYAIPNGGRRDRRTGARLKAEGVKAGMPDLHLPVARGKWHSLYLEVKTRTGDVRRNQRERHESLLRAGNRVEVCRGIDEIGNALLSYLRASEHG